MGITLPPLGASFNGQVPRDGELDPLCEILSWMIIICADGGTEVRYYGRQSQSADTKLRFTFERPFDFAVGSRHLAGIC